MRAWIVFHNVCHLGARLDLYIFGVLVPTPNVSDDKYPLMRQSVQFCPLSLLHRSPLLCFWFSSPAIPRFSWIFPFFIHCCHCCLYFHCLRHRNKIVHQTVMMWWITPFSSNVVFMILGRVPSIRILEIRWPPRCMHLWTHNCPLSDGSPRFWTSSCKT